MKVSEKRTKILVYCFLFSYFIFYAYTPLRADIIGNQVGKGAFSEVLIVRGAKNSKQLEALSPSLDNRTISNVTADSSKSLPEDEDSSTLVIKRVRGDLDEEGKISSTVDLLIESEFLSHLSHPNIVKLIW